MDDIKQALKAAVKDLFGVEVEPELTRPAEQFGDFSTNVAMQLAAKIAKPPHEIAEALVAKIQESELAVKTEVADPGFINIYLTDQAILDSLGQKPARRLEGKEVLVEFGDPNPFKEMHIGHLYTAIVGDAIASLLETAGATVRRLCYHGDVGLHVAKAIWAIQKAGFNDLGNLPESLGHYYVEGNQAFDSNEQIASEIRVLNGVIYEKTDAQVEQIHKQGVAKSLVEFDQIFKELGIDYDKHYLESAATEEGLKLVKAHLGEVFEESQGAIIYRGEKIGLHTRVFISSQGLPTYEAKDLGLVGLKDKDYPNAAQSIIITAAEQADYFKVMLAALAEFNKPLAAKTRHLSHGFLSLSSGKMSSRKGNVVTAEDVLLAASEAQSKAFGQPNKSVEIGAVKYAFLRNRIGADMVFDPVESVSLQGNSGPYLQYAYVRANSILQKVDSRQQTVNREVNLEAGERNLARKLSEYPEVVEAAINDLLPSHICTYLYELAQTFNRFYEGNRVVGDPREAIRLKLVEAYTQVLKNGLELLNIPVLEKM